MTGASSGIGAATAHALGTEGARVVGGARRVKKVMAEIPLALDVRDPGSCERFVREAVEQLGGAIDILVNAAGLALGRAALDESDEESERVVMETNVNGLVRMTRLCLPHLRAGGHIVNIGSVVGTVPYENGAVYCLSKAAVHAFTQALREDLLGRPLRVTTIAPGLVETEFASVRYADDAKAAAAYRGIGMGGPLNPEDVADCVVFAATRPTHVNVEEIVVMSAAQTRRSRFVREEDAS